ncbi:MAG TPA: hypothetical protein VG501_01055, partial [Rhizomicrobium sp.]|nr:hypothetical protein [Rhizomicrobium sp.]
RSLPLAGFAVPCRFSTRARGITRRRGKSKKPSQKTLQNRPEMRLLGTIAVREVSRHSGS